EKSLKEGVRHEVENGGSPGSDTKRQEHIADLADCRIRQYTLDIALGKRAEAGQQKCSGADYCNDELNLRRELKQCMRSRNQINAGSYHRSRMDESAR